MSIAGVGVSADSLAASIGGYQSQIADLERQCADWRGCATTPANEKEKLISALQSQIQTLQHKIEKVEQAPPVSAAYEVADKTQQATQIADGINRPDTDPFAVRGSVVNISI
jgi:proline dehydrogenase